MSDDALLDQAAPIIADARVACLKLGVSPAEIAEIMMDEATFGLMAERLSLSEIQTSFKNYSTRDLPSFYADLNAAADLAKRLLSQ